MINHPIPIRALLEHLDGTPFPISSSDGLRYALRRNAAVQSFAESIRSGAVEESDIRSLVNWILADFRAGARLKYALELAALAVALEGWHTLYSDEYINELAELRLSELEPGPSVARAVRKARSGDAQQSEKSIRFTLLPGGVKRSSHFASLSDAVSIYASA